MKTKLICLTIMILIMLIGIWVFYSFSISTSPIAVNTVTASPVIVDEEKAEVLRLKDFAITGLYPPFIKLLEFERA